MTIEELKELFKSFMRESADDYCIKCAYCDSDKCRYGAWSYNEEGNAEWNDAAFATDTCIDGLYERYKANQK